MAKKQQQVSERTALIRELMAAGQSRKEASGHADKILGERDRIEVDRDGNQRPAPVGPLL